MNNTGYIATMLCPRITVPTFDKY